MLSHQKLTAVFILTWLSHPVCTQTNKEEFTYKLDEGYPIGDKLFGGIAGVDVDRDNNVIIFHRGSHSWNSSTFGANDVYQLSRNSPIPEETVIFINPNEKKIINDWGSNTFFMPHGLSLDLEQKHLWLTDVALHQVFKYSLNGLLLIELGTPFVPGTDEAHFCKPTSVADTGDFIFVADGYCNSRVVMFSSTGKYLGDFGQSPDAYLVVGNTAQPTFNIPHKITYAPEAKMLCIADRENGRIQCFSFEPKVHKGSDRAIEETGLALNGAIKPKFTIADPAFNGRLFSLDYSPIRGGIIVAVSGEDIMGGGKPPLGFVYNVTTGQLLSRFSPPNGRTFGMAHDLAITGEEANALYVVDITPVNLWRFSRAVPIHNNSRAAQLNKVTGDRISRALSMMNSKDRGFGIIWYIVIFSVVGIVLVAITKNRKPPHDASINSFSQLYSNRYPSSINSLFAGSRIGRRSTSHRSSDFFNSVLSGRALMNIFGRSRRQQNEFSRIPLEESDNSDDKSDSDVEEFNINRANVGVKIEV